MTLTALDYELIRQCSNKYLYCLDHGDFEGVASCFEPTEGYFECLGLPEGSPNGGKRIGRQAILKFAEGLFGACQGHGRHSCTVEQIVEIEEGKASYKSYLNCYRPGIYPFVGTYMTAEYDDIFIKKDDKWIILARRPTTDPLSEHANNVPNDVLVTRLDAHVKKVLQATGQAN